MREIPVRSLGVLGALGALGAWTNGPALFGLFALFALFASDRTVEIPALGDVPGRASE